MKFTANELLDSMNREFNTMDMNELFKALIAYSLGAQEITPEDDTKLNEVIDYYFDTDYIRGIINEDVYDYARQLFEGEGE